ncbi:acyl-CoA thioesterase [Nocardiopsis suaedae]|uniref:Thioesterase family protein n=1 Tax=Nocardiopsis suaedae TaxID=3018444 RepID=A0ABT4TKZ8_9ACTN|nr:thioesterase family protein [Nocardiopsis suaedae]MDA2805357.1 thioesterase family protein [Nocardiopsis suaedae]
MLDTGAEAQSAQAADRGGRQGEDGPGAPGRGRRHVHLAHVRFADLDPLNHVNNVRMLTYLEDARIAFLRWDAPGGDGDGGPLGAMVVARHEVDYVAPLVLRRDPVRVETRVTEVRGASFRLAYEILDDERVYLRAESVIVGYDLERQRSRRLTPDELEYLEGYREPA